MKQKATRKKKQTKLDIDKKYIDEQKYAEQNFHLVDTSREIPEYVDESGLEREEDEDIDEEIKIKKVGKEKKNK